ncbi:MAG: hypothetical protein KDC35_00290 [Acidobacteria bacterium]|nr:hypothetical protein [Acidobacteriota bacterium]
MSRQAGMWIDHRQAIIVRLNGARAVSEVLESELESKTQRSRGPLAFGASEKRKERRVESQLDHYYHQVTQRLKDIDVLLIAGPGSAKMELLRVIEETGAARQLTTEITTMDSVTRRQLIARVKEHFNIRTRVPSKRKPAAVPKKVTSEGWT